MTLHHRLDGPEDAPVVVLGPSLGTTLDLWAAHLPALHERWRTLRFDLPGHGRSTARSGFTLEDLAGEVLALLDEHGVDRIGYAGVSVGGAVGATLAVRAPERVASLVLCCSSARFGPPERWRDRAALVREEGVEPMVEAAPGRWFTPGFADVEPYLDMLRAADPAGYAACSEAIGRYDLRDRLPEIRAATLVIAGADDPATPVDQAETLAAGIPGARLEVLPDAAHLAVVQHRAAVGDLIIEHFTSGWSPR